MFQVHFNGFRIVLVRSPLSALFQVTVPAGSSGSDIASNLEESSGGLLGAIAEEARAGARNSDAIGRQQEPGSAS